MTAYAQQIEAAFCEGWGARREYEFSGKCLPQAWEHSEARKLSLETEDESEHWKRQIYAVEELGRQKDLQIVQLSKERNDRQRRLEAAETEIVNLKGLPPARVQVACEAHRDTAREIQEMCPVCLMREMHEWKRRAETAEAQCSAALDERDEAEDKLALP